MRFLCNGPSIPDALLEQCDSGRVVFLCGAGVSFNSGMPTFFGLTEHVIDFFDPPADSQIMNAFSPWLEDASAANVPLDQIFNLLHQEYGKDEVNALVTERLRVPATAVSVGHEHGLIKRISSNMSGTPKIVTTNFDRLFEDDMGAIPTKVHVAPDFPDLSYGVPIEGITYLHGRLTDSDAVHHPYVLSSADFGRAYLSEAWATKFIRSLLETYTVVLIGYQAEDPPVKYLLQGLNHDEKFDHTRLYAFDKGLPEDIEAKWRDRGVTAIAYSDHRQLWETIEAWAIRADDPREWRNMVISTAQRNPSELLPHQRGQVAHVLRTTAGAKLFADADETPHPEWICVLDAYCRSGKKSRGYGEKAETFEPFKSYGLDDDLEDISEEDRKRGIRNDNLLEWRIGDDNATDDHRLSVLSVQGHEVIPARLSHIIRWFGKSIHSPVLAWWAARQFGLHPRLIKQIQFCLRNENKIHEKARHIWNLIIERHQDARNRDWDGEWFDLQDRIANEGWSLSVMRDFDRVSQPRLWIMPPLGLSSSKPPQGDWDDVELGNIWQAEVKFLELIGQKLDVPDGSLIAIFSILESHFLTASALLSDLSVSYFETPTCYPSREVEGGEDYPEAADVFNLFVHLYERLACLHPKIAAVHVTGWDEKDQYFFRKLKLFALSNPDVFEPMEVVHVINALDQEVFWDINVIRELLFLIVDRWPEFSANDKGQLTERILAGPDQLEYSSNEEYHTYRNEFAARYGRYLELQGCELQANHQERLAKVIKSVPDWNDGWAISIVTKRGSSAGWVKVDEAPDAVSDLPINEIVAQASANLQYDFENNIEKRPFTGLVKTNPRKAFLALTLSAKSGDFPQALWTSLITELPSDISPRLYRAFLNRVARLPDKVVAELRYPLGRWLEQNITASIAFDTELAWQLYDHIVDGIFSGGSDATESGLGEVSQGGVTLERSRRTIDHAINGPVGKCTEALVEVLSETNPQEDSGVPDHIRTRLERLLSAPGEGADHAISICMRQLNWIMYVDPAWANERLVPLLAFEHTSSEPAWNGLLQSSQPPTPALAEAIKPLLLELYPWLENCQWEHRISERGAEWMAWMCIFRNGEPDGLSGSEMRSVLRCASDQTRNRVIFWLGKVGEGNEDGWVKHVVPFVDKVWPRERRFRTNTSIVAWVNLLGGTKDYFPIVYAAVKKFLAPIEEIGHGFFRLTREVDSEAPITVKHPEVALDLLNTVVAATHTGTHHELLKILTMIAENQPALTTDTRYLRLIELVERN